MKHVQIKPPTHVIPASKEVEVSDASALSQSPEGFGQLPIDILENEKEILVITPIAGVDLDKTEVIVTNDVLTIRGERQTDLSDFDFKKRDYYVQECFWGRFSRSVILPANVDSQKIEATQKDHVLYIRIPKRSAIRMRIVKIKS
ncbi:Hsp20/alpha crystallin family protein [Candidatus Peregrinibacteria bacterium]|nr:Hsp20/alpha crystallin family protein [Candidatus Peregrinibacteria bacterium]